jgi:hypothetical protein
MKDWIAIRERYLRDAVPVRLGGLAANLARIRAFAALGGSDDVVASLIHESRHFIEWTAAAMEVNAAAELVSLQVELAVWERTWPRIREDPSMRKELTEKAEDWSRRVMNMSGLLSPDERGAGILRGEESLSETLREELRKEREGGR